MIVETGHGEDWILIVYNSLSGHANTLFAAESHLLPVHCIAVFETAGMAVQYVLDNGLDDTMVVPLVGVGKPDVTFRGEILSDEQFWPPYIPF